MPNECCPTCHRPYDEVEQLLEPDENGQGPTLQTIVDRLAKRAAQKRHQISEGYPPRDYIG